MQSNPEMNAAPATNGKRMNLLKLLKRLLFQKKQKVRKHVQIKIKTQQGMTDANESQLLKTHSRTTDH